MMERVLGPIPQHMLKRVERPAEKYVRKGLLTGCFVSLFSVYAILAHISGIFSPTKGIIYMKTVYPVFSVFALLSLHLFMYGCNLFMWKKTRINYNFIFEFFPTTALKYRDAFLICTTFMTAVVAAMVLHIILRASGFSPSQVDAIPGLLLMVFIVFLVSPFDIFYRPTRYCFIRVIRNIICSPFYKVLMVDFFMADQLTSQGLNVVLRVTWVETVMGFRIGVVESRLVDFLLASLEVIRRGHWNFYRIENEHLCFKTNSVL
uniref:EXS domain-containing protein n=3 Tax=Cannabis sativa TaxID=3483 RepID=A0A803R9T6_CANSA